MRRVEPRCRITASRSRDGGVAASAAAAGHGSPRASASPARWARVISGNSSGALSTAPGAASPVGSTAGRPSPKREQRDGELVRAVGADELASRAASGKRVRSAGPGLRRERQRLREQRARVPVDVPEAALGVAPGRAPRHAGDDERRRLAVRGRPDLPQRVRRPGRTSARRRRGRRRRGRRGRARAGSGRRPSPPRGTAASAGPRARSMRTTPALRYSSARERREVQRRGRVVEAGEDGGRRPSGRRATRVAARTVGSVLRVALQGHGQRAKSLATKSCSDERVLDRDGELPLRCVRAQAVVEAGGVPGRHRPSVTRPRSRPPARCPPGRRSGTAGRPGKA